LDKAKETQMNAELLAKAAESARENLMQMGLEAEEGRQKGDS
jgi:hypothetical protein